MKTLVLHVSLTLEKIWRKKKSLAFDRGLILSVSYRNAAAPQTRHWRRTDTAEFWYGPWAVAAVPFQSVALERRAARTQKRLREPMVNLLQEGDRTVDAAVNSSGKNTWTSAFTVSAPRNFLGFFFFSSKWSKPELETHDVNEETFEIHQRTLVQSRDEASTVNNKNSKSSNFVFLSVIIPVGYQELLTTNCRISRRSGTTTMKTSSSRWLTGQVHVV